ncbi:ABC transporter substrate-binding protein [Demequina lignilytica]|uniref:ABC transporter substrate-binding protein n=1 Tax=Demequina lignilytica TaxID=3051663 RepID=A0AAW7M4R5_9MICO|nr:MULTISPECIES: ABC transporter substrate-binding protein [unclassified Demequina]MDN4478794.1 ABC transporter substrate-binding protein [Demequina sp. SYSU T00039-1]MDN4484107.1 ABC transporter substrate-binding protein [Demequina sp. SYSU T0a273]MDN4488892.1 ABC transporter substrate-binding protein [Demequina sp. SYSU T00039]MDN4490310.1 ABC transporter substrate-binding protein [Demequina sp. SYSU T00068]
MVAGTAAFAIALTGCGGSSSPEGSSSADGDTTGGEPVTLTVATFNDFGYTDALLQEYMDANPNVTVVQNIAATSNDARTNYFAKLGAGGLADVEAIEVDWLPEVMQYADLVEDLSSADVEGRWLDWKTEAATDPDGRLIGYGTDIGPEAICYDAAKFEAAGLPTDPAEVASLLEGDWAHYFEVGEQYQAGGGGAWFESANATYQGMINQVAAAYEDPDTGEIIATDNAEVKDLFMQVTEAAGDLSAHLPQWSDDWFAGLAQSEFATLLCPGWMLGVVQGAAPDTTTWNVADVFPGGGGNWGGSYLTVPSSGENLEEAKKLAAWLTAPEQQLKALAAAGTFPSQTDALADLDAINAAFASGDSPTKAEYFNTDSLGDIFSSRADAVSVAPFKGEFYFQVNDIIQNALTRVEDGSQDATTSWDQAVAEISALG